MATAKPQTDAEKKKAEEEKKKAEEEKKKAEESKPKMVEKEFTETKTSVKTTSIKIEKEGNKYYKVTKVVVDGKVKSETRKEVKPDDPAVQEYEKRTAGRQLSDDELAAANMAGKNYYNQMVEPGKGTESDTLKDLGGHINSITNYATLIKDMRRFRGSAKSDFCMFDTPGLVYFKILFHFMNSSDAGAGSPKAVFGCSGNELAGDDDDAMSGLLGPTWLRFPSSDFHDQQQYLPMLWAESTAYNYFVLNDDEYRANATKQFIELLSNINSNTPWYFQSVKGIANAINREVVMHNDFTISDDRQKITIECMEDSVDMRIGTLLDLYRSIVWSWETKRMMLPINLRKFDMTIVAFQVPIQGMYIPRTGLDMDETEIRGVNAIVDTPAGFASYYDDGTIGPITSYKAWEFHGCEIDYNSSQTGWDTITNVDGTQNRYNIDILFDDCMELRFNEFTGTFITDIVGDITGNTVTDRIDYPTNVDDWLKENSTFKGDTEDAQKKAEEEAMRLYGGKKEQEDIQKQIDRYNKDLAELGKKNSKLIDAARKELLAEKNAAAGDGKTGKKDTKKAGKAKDDKTKKKKGSANVEKAKALLRQIEKLEEDKKHAQERYDKALPGVAQQEALKKLNEGGDAEIVAVGIDELPSTLVVPTYMEPGSETEKQLQKLNAKLNKAKNKIGGRMKALSDQTGESQNRDTNNIFDSNNVDMAPSDQSLGEKDLYEVPRSVSEEDINVQWMESANSRRSRVDRKKRDLGNMHEDDPNHKEINSNPNVLEQILGAVIHDVNHKLNHIYLGNLYDMSISRIRQQLGELADGNFWATRDYIKDYLRDNYNGRGTETSENIFPKPDINEIKELGNIFTGNTILNS